MLIKDPYLDTQSKPIEIPPPINSLPFSPSPPVATNPNISTFSQPVWPQSRGRAISGQVEMQARVNAYQRQLRAMEMNAARQDEIARKILGVQETNRHYHEAMRVRNFQLNTKLSDAACEVQLANQRTQQEYMRFVHQKESLMKRHQDQNQELLRVRASLSTLLEQKTRLQEQLNNVTFILEKERQQGELEIREMAFRMESMDHTYRGLLSAKEQELAQLNSRMRLYEEENRKLNDINRTLQLTRDRPERIDTLSQIHHVDSNLKTAGKDRDKENEDLNVQRSFHKDSHGNNNNNNFYGNINSNQQLKEQKATNELLRKELEKVKQQLEQVNRQNCKLKEKEKTGERALVQSSRWQGTMASVVTLRQGICKEVFEIFFKSVRDGQKRKQNSLVIFIQNWRYLQMSRLQPYIKSYFEARNALKRIAETPEARESVHYDQMEELIPIRVGARTGRSNINQWILSTIQFTKNQKEAAKKNLNNFLLFLFRLLTIQYRVKYPMQGKSYSLDSDVTNELLHETVKAVQLISQYN